MSFFQGIVCAVDDVLRQREDEELADVLLKKSACAGISNALAATSNDGNLSTLIRDIVDVELVFFARGLVAKSAKVLLKSSLHRLDGGRHDEM